MKTSSRKAKGRRLQVLLADTLSRELKLTVDAESPTRPGKKPSGAVYVPEGQGDLRVRRSGMSGCDVALISERSEAAVLHPISACRSFDSCTRSGRQNVHIKPYFECKNTESWNLSSEFFFGEYGKTPPLIVKALSQSIAGARRQNAYPVLCIAKNRSSPLIVFHCSYKDAKLMGAFLVEYGRNFAVRTISIASKMFIISLETYVWMLKEMQKRN